MTNNTDLANSALALLGEMPIASIDDVNSKPARFCKQFADSARIEVLRMLYLTESTLIQNLDALQKEAVAVRLAARVALPLLGAHELQGKMETLFSIRLQEAKARGLQSSALNGKILAMIGADLAKIDLSPTLLNEFFITYAAQALDEVLRMGRWACAIKRETLTASTVPAVGSFSFSYYLPQECIRVLEVNGEAVGDSDEYFEIEGRAILTNSNTCWIRYVDRISLEACDPLLQVAIQARQAAKIAAALTLPSTPALESLYQKRLAEARQADAQECGSRENPSWARVFGRSRLISSKVRTRNPLRLEGY